MDDNTVKPYYLSLGEKLVKDLDGLDLLRNLYPEQYQAMAEYIGETIQDEVEYALRSHERSAARRARLVGHIFEEPMDAEAFKKNLKSATRVQYVANGSSNKIGYGGDNLIVPSAPTTGSPYVPTSEVVCRCADNRFCPAHDVQSSYTGDNDFGPHITYHPDGLDLTTPDGQAEFQRECEQGLWEIVNHPKFYELVRMGDGLWTVGIQGGRGGTAPDLLGIMDLADEVLKGNYKGRLL